MRKVLKEKLSVDLFVALSLVGFVVFGAIFVYFSPGNEINFLGKGKNESGDKYYLNEKYNDSDPFITKNPSLKDILVGPIISQNDPMQGDKFSPVTLVYFSDFECSFCQKQEQVLKKLTANYKYKVKLIWKDYPQREKDSMSYKSAVAGRCAQMQGKFWEYHDFLFNDNSVDEEKFFSIAKNVELDEKSFRKCYEDRGVERLIDDNMEEADALQITGIPYIFVNQKDVMGEISYEELEEMVLMELE